MVAWGRGLAQTCTGSSGSRPFCTGAPGMLVVVPKAPVGPLGFCSARQGQAITEEPLFSRKPCCLPHAVNHISKAFEMRLTASQSYEMYADRQGQTIVEEPLSL
jgi:hypothetical protein